MNLLVIVGLFIGLLVLHWLRLPMLLWIAIWPAVVWLFVRFGIEVLVPASVLNMYIALTFVGVLAYIFVDAGRFNKLKGQFVSFVTERKYNTALYGVLLLLPALLALKIYFDMNVEVRAATFGRTVHPAPPGEITFKGKKIDLIKGKNPFRELETSDRTAYDAHVAAGKVVYYQNCVFCHGDDMAGDGLFAYSLHPVPANFNSPTTIAMLQEAYLFWRIAKGGPGLPEESGPWSSSMPAWEKFLTEEQIWDVILFLYEYTGYKPRAEEEHHE